MADDSAGRYVQLTSEREIWFPDEATRRMPFAFLADLQRKVRSDSLPYNHD